MEESCWHLQKKKTCTFSEFIQVTKRLPSAGTNAGNDSSPYVHVLNQDVQRGGVKVETGRDPEADLVISRLSLARARASDTGNYTCALGGLLPEARIPGDDFMRGLVDTVAVHVIRADNTEAIHSSSVRKNQDDFFRGTVKLDFLALAVAIGLSRWASL